MIIEIKDLPSGRKVKHISVDITFEEDGSPVVKTSTAEEPKEEIKFENVEPPKVQDSQREQKEIPPEMSDMEF